MTRLTKELALATERELYVRHQRGEINLSEAHASVCFGDLADQWLSRPTDEQGIRTRAISTQYRIARFKKAWGSRSLRTLTYDDLEAYVRCRQEEDVLPSTINRELRDLQSMMNYAIKRRLLTDNPWEAFDVLKGATSRVRWMTEEEVHRLCTSALNLHDPQLVDVILVGINTGFRKGNLERLTSADLLPSGILARKTKSRKPYEVPYTEVSYQILQRLAGDRPQGAPLLYTRNLDRRFREAATLVGLYPQVRTKEEAKAAKRDTNKVSVHTLRHTFAAHYLQKGGDIYRLSKLLGHSSVNITEKVYAHVPRKTLQAEAPLLNIGGGFLRSDNGPISVDTWLTQKSRATVQPSETN